MNLKKIVMTLLQAGVTLLLLWLLFHDPAKRQQMVEALHTANLVWLIPGFVSFGLVLLIGTIRWNLLMQVQGIRMGFFRVWQLVMIGMFFNLCLPGGVGGDLVKVFFAMREAPKSKSAVFLSIVADRSTGMFALILVSIGVFGYFHGILMSLPMVRAFLLVVSIIFCGFIGLIVMGLIIDRFHLAKRLPAKMPGYAAVLDIARAFSVYARAWKAIVVAIGLSLLLNLFIFGTAIFAAFAFVGNPGAAAMTSVIPIVNTISSLPISLAGIGVREKLFATMLHSLYNTSENLAVLISITGFALAVIWGLIGGLIYMTYRTGDGSHASLGEMQSQVADVEYQVESEEKA
ncbi:MAG: lysylphosphatidylglycerol synthase transmembrane domain-containing protein [bacterium]